MSDYTDSFLINFQFAHTAIGSSLSLSSPQEGTINPAEATFEEHTWLIDDVETFWFDSSHYNSEQPDYYTWTEKFQWLDDFASAFVEVIDNNGFSSEVTSSGSVGVSSVILYSEKNIHIDDFIVGVNTYAGNTSLTGSAYPEYQIFEIDDGKASFSIDGKAEVGQIFIVSQDSEDPDGIPDWGGPSYSWQWSSDNENWFEVATTPSFLIPSGLENKYIKAVVSYTDEEGFAENISTESYLIPIDYANYTASDYESTDWGEVNYALMESNVYVNINWGLVDYSDYNNETWDDDVDPHKIAALE